MLAERRPGGCRTAPLALAPVLLAALACGAGAPSPSPRELLAAAVGPRRVLEARLAGPFPYARWEAESAAAAREGLDAARLAAAEVAVDHRAGERSPRALAEKGALALVRGRWSEAVNLLSEAAALAGETPEAAALRGDLAAALHARASSGDGRGRDAIAAIAAALGAVALDPDLAVAHCNLALALEGVSLRYDAERHWRRCAELETDPGWRREARERAAAAAAEPSPSELWARARARLDDALARRDDAEVAAIAERFPQECRLYAQEELLRRWVEAVPSEDAAVPLDAARRLAAAVARRDGDALLPGAVAAIDAAWGEPSAAARRSALFAGHRAFVRGLARSRERDMELAGREFETAAEALVRGGSPLALSARFHAAVCLYQRRRPTARSALLALAGELESRPYPVLRGRVEWMLGLHDLFFGARPYGAVERFEAAIELLEGAGQWEDGVTAHQRLALALEYLGRRDEAWDERLVSLRAIPRLANPMRVHTALSEAGEAALREGGPEVALRFQNELTRRAEVWSGPAEPEALSQALLRRARTLASAGRTEEARGDLDRARRSLARVGDPGLATQIAAAVTLAEGEVLLAAGDASAAAGALRQALAQYAAVENRFYLAFAHLLSARAALEQGGEGEAEDHLQRALAEVENQGATIPDEISRLAFLEQAQSLFDEMVAFQLDHRRDPARAFEHSERARARLLRYRRLRQRGPGEPSPPPEPAAEPRLTLPALRAALPEGTAVLAWHILPDRLLAWLVRRETFRFHEIPLDPAELEEARAELVEGIALRRSETAIRSAAEALHGRLIAPFRDDLRPDDLLVMLPDGPLHHLPFAALRDAASGRLLVEDHPVAVAPGGAAYLAALARAGSGDRGAPRHLLAVGDPAPDPRAADLPPLPAAAEEARAAAALYEDARLLLGAEATRAAFLAALPEAEVLLFAGHATANPDRPHLSAFHLAPDPASGTPGPLYAHELEGLALPRLRLAIFSACRTAAGTVPRAAGATGLAHPFLAAGVPAVLTTLWEIDDRATAALLPAFHRHLLAGLSPARALRATQLEALARPDPALRAPHAWAAFQCVGGGG